MVQNYRYEIDKGIIKILYENKTLTHGELKTRLEELLKCKISPDLYSKRLKQMRSNNKHSKPDKSSLYVIYPMLEMKDNGRGSKVYYSLTTNTRIRCDLKLPILKSESILEKAYFLLLQYLSFDEPSSQQNHFKFNNRQEYNRFLEKLHISKNALDELGKPSFNKTGCKFINRIHPESQIIFTRIDYLEDSNKFKKCEYYCKLTGISASEISSIQKRSKLPLEYVTYSLKDATECLKLLEKQNIIKQIQSLPLLILNQERYILIDNSLKDLLQKCWVIYGIARLHLDFIWKYLRKPTEDEKIWFEYMNGKRQTQLWLINYNITRKKYSNNPKKMSDDVIRKRLRWGTQGMKKKYDFLLIGYKETINKYSFLIEPLLNQIYPVFLRHELI